MYLWMEYIIDLSGPHYRGLGTTFTVNGPNYYIIRAKGSFSRFRVSQQRKSSELGKLLNGTQPRIYIFCIFICSNSKRKTQQLSLRDCLWETKRQLLRESDDSTQKREWCQMSSDFHRRCSRNTLALVLTDFFLNLMQMWYITNYSAKNVQSCEKDPL